MAVTMNSHMLLIAALLWMSHMSCTDKGAAMQEGDIIFHTSKSTQSKAIQIATQSRYSHMGIIYVENGKRYVYEAVQPVKLTPLGDWIRRGEGRHYIVKRLKNARELLTPENLRKMRKTGEALKGKPYDLFFEWSDDRIYCSELVWKIYKQALGIEVGKLQKLREFNLSDPFVKSKLIERYGGKTPLDEPVISPGAMFDSELLETVVSR